MTSRFGNNIIIDPDAIAVHAITGPDIDLSGNDTVSEEYLLLDNVIYITNIIIMSDSITVHLFNVVPAYFYYRKIYESILLDVLEAIEDIELVTKYTASLIR